MKKYELKYTKGETGVFRISTVESPAVGATLVMFDNETKLMEFQDDEKQIIYSVAMRPNMLILRKNINGEPAMVFYSEETVADLQQNFFKNNSHNGATINHDKNIRNDIYAFESWIVQDPQKDKATLLGMAVEKGDWVLGQKVDNLEVWQDIKNGKLQGFSIEAYLEPILINNQIEMSAEEIDERIKNAIKMSKEEDVAKLKEEEEAKAKLAMEDAPIAKETTPAPDAPSTEELQKKISAQATEINDLKAKLAEYETKEVEMSKQLVEMKSEIEKGLKPSATPAKKYEEMTALERFRANK
jgi:hypothetical protein